MNDLTKYALTIIGCIYLISTAHAQVAPKGNNIPNNINQPNSNIKIQQVSPTVTNPTGNNPNTTYTSGGCYSRQVVFGELYYSNETREFTWTVPDGVTQISIEAWSGGGNGFTETLFSTITRRASTEYAFKNMLGGGGGGGAYANALIPVKTGDKLFISIPPGGGGKSLQVKLNNNTNMFYLNNGSDGYQGGMNGQGGNSGGAYGVFKNNLYWISGEDGELARVNDHYYQLGRDGDGLLLEDRITIEKYVLVYGNGGDAALLNNGGRSAIYSRSGHHNTVPATNGKFPGGGGGGGDNTRDEMKNGKGAPGMVIIRY